MKKQSRAVDEQLESLNDLAEAVNYNQWIADLIEPYLGDRVIDIGCGTGNFIHYLSRRKILGLDVSEAYLKIARKKFKNNKNVQFARTDLGKGLGRFKSFKPDTIIAVNVLEHVEKDEALLRDCAALLSKNGKIILFTPAIPWLFGEMDRTYGHFRRYKKLEMALKLKKNGFDLERCEYLNFSGIFGWWLNGQILKRKRIPRGQMLAYDKIFKYVFLLEKLLPKFIGLSIFTVGHKKN